MLADGMNRKGRGGLPRKIETRREEKELAAVEQKKKRLL